MRLSDFLFCLLFLSCLHFLLASFVNQPQYAGPDVPEGKLKSLSFAPFREGFSPLEKKFPLPEHIEEDLRLLADKTEAIRTYSSLGGMNIVPELARNHGMAMIQGAWLGYGKKDNRLEIDALIESANAHPDVVNRVIVGNEVLLRGEMDPERLIEYIREVKNAIGQPVSYADVWSMYMKYPQIIREVDFITIHILPYWEDEPIPVGTAPEHIERIYRQVRQEADSIAPGKPILIGESGWPSFGRQRGGAVPGVVNEALFIRQLLKTARDNEFDYNIVEAFNQPWKSNLEGAVGANWGLYSAARKQVFPLTGPVMENPDWMMRVLFSASLGLLVAFFYYRRLSALAWPKILVFLVFIQILAASLFMPIDELWSTAYSISRRVYVLLIAIVNTVTAGLLLQRGLAILTESHVSARLAKWLDSVYLLLIALALYKTYGLATYGRYLDFPYAELSLSVVGLIGLTVCSAFTGGKWVNVPPLCDLFGYSRAIANPRTIFYLLCFALIALLAGETNAFMSGRDFIAAYPEMRRRLTNALYYTLINQQLLIWLGYLALLAVFYYPNDRRSFSTK